VRTVMPGDFVVGSFWASDNSCDICQAGYQAYCLHRVLMGTLGTQSELARIPLADGTLVATPGQPHPVLIPSLMAASDVLGTGWFAAVVAEAGPGKTVAVVGDGAVGLLGVLAARQLGAERIIVFSRHTDRQSLAREFGATDIVTERGDAGAAAVKELTGGLGAHSVIEAVGTQEAMMQAIGSTRPGGHVGFVGVSHDVAIPGDQLFTSGVHIHGGGRHQSSYSPSSYTSPTPRASSDRGGSSGGGGAGRSTRPRWSPVNSPVTYSSDEVAALDRYRQKVEAVGPRAESYDLFLCHAWDDRRETATELHGLLEAQDVLVWFSERDILLGLPFMREIDKGLAKTRIGLVLITPAFLQRIESGGVSEKEL
jgi:NADPH:quinone reductase-like Zn-dependent oxidoreductase